MSSTGSAYARLVTSIQELQSVLVAFSGGVDSALVAKAAVEALGENALAATAISPTLPKRERLAAKETAKAIGIRQVEVEADELRSSDFRENTPLRCYYCKHVRIAALRRFSTEAGFAHILDGANADDSGDWRPGLKANEELGVVSPLVEAGIGKDEVRVILKQLGLSVWEKPSSPCLASRIPYGNEVTADKLAQIEAAEEYLFDLGVTDARVRHHGQIARVEIPRAEFSKVLDDPAATSRLKDLGFSYVSLDLDGLRSGSLNEVLEP